VYWYTINYAAGSLVAFLVGLFVLFRGESRGLTRRSWFALCVVVSLWHVGKFLIVTAASESFASWAAYLIYIAAILIPPSYLHFILALLGEERSHRTVLRASYLLAGVEYLLLLDGRLIAGVAYLRHIGFYEVPSQAYWLYVINYTVVPSFAIVRLAIVFGRSESAVKKNQLKYVIYSSLIGFIAGITSFLPIIGSSIPPFGAPVVYFYTVPITYAVARYRLLDIDVVIKKSVIYAVLLLGLLLPCYGIVILGQKLAFGAVSYEFSISTLVLLIIVAFFFPKLRFRTEEALERVFFKKRIDYRDTLLRSSRDMVSIVSIRALADNLVRTIGKSLSIEKVSLLLNNDAKASYGIEATVGLDFDRPEEIFLSRGSPLIQLLQRRKEPIVKEELEWIPVGPETSQTIETMAKLGAEICLPILSKDTLIGILNLGHKEDRTIYSNEDLEMLSTLTNQAAIAIENARLYENLKQSQDTLRRADRLSSLGLLTAGLAHEIRNPLVAIRTFTQLLPERYDDAEFREGFQGLALKEVDRICGLINDLLSFARPSKPNVVPENVNDVVDNITRILETQAKEKNVVIARDFGDNLPKAWIDREQMKQVFMNLILNAIQAMQEGGSISISTRAISRNGTEPSGEFVQVEVRDTGIGIPEENVQHIFDPFFTSKDEGSGLGLAVSHQIVQEHGGFVTVESTVGKGTAFFVHVPVGKPVRPAANGRAQVNEANLSH
jgi:two-component system, NtrC family, sensor kinase